MGSQNIPKSLIIPTVLRDVITQNIYITFVMAKALDHLQLLCWFTTHKSFKVFPTHTMKTYGGIEVYLHLFVTYS